MRKWTNVEDGLPKGILDKKGYLCECCINDNVESPFYMVLNYYPGEDAHFQHESYMGLKVMRWMPIPVESNDGWISVNDALPDNDRTVEVIVKNWGGGRITYEHTYDFLSYNETKGTREWLYGDGRGVDIILWKEANRYSNRNI